MKKKISNIIRILGIDVSELVLDIKLSSFEINSIELYDNNKILLHIFKEDDLDIEIDFDDISKEDQKIILVKLSQIAFN